MNQLEDALKNMLGAFDSPLTRLKMGTGWTEFHTEAVESARNAINNGNPLYAPELPGLNSPTIFIRDVQEGETIIFTKNDKKFILIQSDSPKEFSFIKIGFIQSDGKPYFFTEPGVPIQLNPNTVVDRLIVQ